MFEDKKWIIGDSIIASIIFLVSCFAIESVENNPEWFLEENI